VRLAELYVIPKQIMNQNTLFKTPIRFSALFDGFFVWLVSYATLCLVYFGYLEWRFGVSFLTFKVSACILSILIGGYVTAHLARNTYLLHGAILGLLLAFLPTRIQEVFDIGTMSSFDIWNWGARILVVALAIAGSAIWQHQTNSFSHAKTA
jgi:hypothetical protein